MRGSGGVLIWRREARMTYSSTIPGFDEETGCTREVACLETGD
jgi:hypothetical protein